MSELQSERQWEYWKIGGRGTNNSRGLRDLLFWKKANGNYQKDLKKLFLILVNKQQTWTERRLKKYMLCLCVCFKYLVQLVSNRHRRSCDKC